MEVIMNLEVFFWVFLWPSCQFWLMSKLLRSRFSKKVPTIARNRSRNRLRLKLTFSWLIPSSFFFPSNLIFERETSGPSLEPRPSILSRVRRPLELVRWPNWPHPLFLSTTSSLTWSLWAIKLPAGSLWRKISFIIHFSRLAKVEGSYPVPTTISFFLLFTRYLFSIKWLYSDSAARLS